MIEPFVALTMRKGTRIPPGLAERGDWQVSTPLVASAGAATPIVGTTPRSAVGDSRKLNVGSASRVGLGSSVGLGRGVGGRGVSVGLAACVKATIVFAAAMAEAWIMAGSCVGVAAAPQALSSKASITVKNNKVRFICAVSNFRF